MKRDYKEVLLEESGGAYCILLDGKYLRTPEGHKFCHGSRDLMDAVAEEWRETERGKTLNVGDMGLTCILQMLCDRLRGGRDEFEAETLKILETDLVLYRAELAVEGGRLREDQDRSWQGYVESFERDLDVVLAVKEGVMYEGLGKGVLEKVGSWLGCLSDDDVLLVGMVSSRTGSLVLGYGFLGGMDVEELVLCCTVEERMMSRRWGEDEEELQRMERLRKDLWDVGRWRELKGY